MLNDKAIGHFVFKIDHFVTAGQIETNFNFCFKANMEHYHCTGTSQLLDNIHVWLIFQLILYGFRIE